MGVARSWFKLLLTRKVLFTIAILLIFYFLLLRGGADKSKIKVTNVERNKITSDVSGSGVVTVVGSAKLRFPVAGKVVSVPVKEGDFVKKGQIIATLDRERFEIALRQVKQDIAVADAELEKIYDSTKDDDSESFDEKIVRTTAEAKKNKAFDNMKAVERNLRDSVLVAPIAGKVVFLEVQAQEEVFATDEIATIVDDKTGNEFEADVDETEISKVQVGQKVKINLDAFENDEIESEVISIGEVSTVTSTGATAYKVRMNFPGEDKFKIGMNGEARIISEEVFDALILSYDALIDDDFVWVRQGESFEKVKVTRGLESDLDFEVKEGLNEGMEVVIAGFDEIGKQSRLDKLLNLL